MCNFMRSWVWLGVLAMVLGGGAAWAQPGGDGGDRPGRAANRQSDNRGMDRGMWSRLLADIDLTDEQRAEIRESLNEAREQRQAWWREHADELRDLRESLREARKAGDREQFREYWARLGELMYDAPQHGTVIESARDTLTDEQWEKLQANMEAARERMRQRMNRPHAGKDGRGNSDNGKKNDKRRGGRTNDD